MVPVFIWKSAGPCRQELSAFMERANQREIVGLLAATWGNRSEISMPALPALPLNAHCEGISPPGVPLVRNHVYRRLSSSFALPFE